MDDKSTPIESLNNHTDESQVVNQILSKYNNLDDNANNMLPPMNPDVSQMEDRFENRNLNQEIYNHSSDNNPYKEHYKNEQKRLQHYSKESLNEQEDDEDEEYEEYEMVEIPLWRRVLNEIRIPLFIIIFIIAFSNCSFDKMLIKTLPIMGNQFNDCNTYGFLFKAFLISVFSYILIRFVSF